MFLERPERTRANGKVALCRVRFPRFREGREGRRQVPHQERSVSPGVGPAAGSPRARGSWSPLPATGLGVLNAGAPAPPQPGRATSSLPAWFSHRLLRKPWSVKASGQIQTQPCPGPAVGAAPGAHVGPVCVWAGPPPPRCSLCGHVGRRSGGGSWRGLPRGHVEDIWGPVRPAPPGQMQGCGGQGARSPEGGPVW